MTDWRGLCAALLDSLKTLHKQSVTAPCVQTLEIAGVRHAIPIGNDILAQDCLHGYLITRTEAALAQPEPEVLTDEEILRLAAKELGYEFSSKWFLTGRNCPSLETNPYELLSFARSLLASAKQ